MGGGEALKNTGEIRLLQIQYWAVKKALTLLLSGTKKQKELLNEP